MFVFAVCFLISGAAVLAVAFKKKIFWMLVAWFAAFALLPFVIFRCPHCRAYATFTASGLATPFVGKRCRHCGRLY